MRYVILFVIAIVAIAAVYVVPQNVSAQILPTAVITPDDIDFGDIRVGLTSQVLTFTVTKTPSVLPLLIFSASLADEVNFAIASDGCSGQTLGDGESCEIGVTFSPGEAARFINKMTLIDLGRNIIDTAGLTGRGVEPAVTLSTTAIDFGDQTINLPSSLHQLLIVNSGTADLTVTDIVTTGEFTQTDDCDTSVVPGDSCMSEITFTPTALGAAAGTLTITDDAADSPQVVTLQGDGIAPLNPDVSLSTHVLDFGSELVGSASDAMPVTLTNVGTVPLNIASIVAGGDFSQTNNCPAAVAPTGTCIINAVFEPTTTGDLAGTVTITDDATDSPQTVTLSGTGVAPDTPHMSLAPGNLDFGEQTVDTPSDAQTITLANDGTAEITGDSSTVTGDGAHSFSVIDHCAGVTINIGDTCTVEVTFNPTVDGSLSATFTITNDASDSPQTITLSGTGMGGGTGGGGCSLMRRK